MKRYSKLIKGRAIVKESSNVGELLISAKIFNSIKLKTSIILAKKYFNEEIAVFAIRQISNLPIVYPYYGSLLRRLICSEMLSIRSNDSCHLGLFLCIDVALWKSARLDLRQLYLNTFLQTDEYKSRFSTQT
jgi:hypothetical protein